MFSGSCFTGEERQQYFRFTCRESLMTVRLNKKIGYIYPFHALLKSDVHWYADGFVLFFCTSHCSVMLYLFCCSASHQYVSYLFHECLAIICFFSSPSQSSGTARRVPWVHRGKELPGCCAPLPPAVVCYYPQHRSSVSGHHHRRSAGGLQGYGEIEMQCKQLIYTILSKVLEHKS